MEQRFSKLLLVRNRNSMIVLAPNQARVLSLQTLADMQKHNSTHITYFTHHLFFIGLPPGSMLSEYFFLAYR